MKQIMTFICFFILGLFLMRSVSMAEARRQPDGIAQIFAAAHEKTAETVSGFPAFPR